MATEFTLEELQHLNQIFCVWCPDGCEVCESAKRKIAELIDQKSPKVLVPFSEVVEIPEEYRKLGVTEWTREGTRYGKEEKQTEDCNQPV
jgi:hypothetical protein